MPTSNGQITRRDIRQAAVQTSHLTDDLITEPKLLDLAVSVDKNNAPSFVFANESNGFHNITLTTTVTEVSSFTVTIPSWVGIIHVFAIATLQLTNTSGSDVNGLVSCRVNDELDGTGDQTIINGDTGRVHHVEAVSISTPGSTVQISNYSGLSSGTNTSNNGRVYGIVLGER